MDNKLVRHLAIIFAILVAFIAVRGLVLFNNVYQQHEEVHSFVNADEDQPISSGNARILYKSICTIGNVRDEDPDLSDSFEKQVAYCNGVFKKSKAGYYIHDFNVGRSIYLSERMMREYDKYGIAKFPKNGLVGSGNSVVSEYIGVNPCRTENNGLSCFIEGTNYSLEARDDEEILVSEGYFTEYKITKAYFFPLTSPNYSEFFRHLFWLR